MFVLRALGIWCGFLVAIVSLGALRDLLLTPRIGEPWAHRIGTLAACAAVAAICAWRVPRLRLTERGALALGTAWLAMALGFEFGFFHFARGVPWEAILRDYDLRAGRLLILLWLTVALAPWAVTRWGRK